MLDVPHGIKFIGKYDGVTSGIFGFSMHTNLPLHRTFVENLMVYIMKLLKSFGVLTLC